MCRLATPRRLHSAFAPVRGSRKMNRAKICRAIRRVIQTIDFRQLANRIQSHRELSKLSNCSRPRLNAACGERIRFTLPLFIEMSTCAGASDQRELAFRTNPSMVIHRAAGQRVAVLPPFHSLQAFFKNFLIWSNLRNKLNIEVRMSKTAELQWLLTGIPPESLPFRKSRVACRLLILVAREGGYRPLPRQLKSTNSGI